MTAIHFNELAKTLLLELTQSINQHTLVHTMEFLVGSALSRCYFIQCTYGVRLTCLLNPVVDHIAIFLQCVPVHLPLMAFLIQRGCMSTALQMVQYLQNELSGQATFN